MGDAGISGQFLFNRLDFRTHNVPPVVEHSADVLLNLFPNPLLLCG